MKAKQIDNIFTLYAVVMVIAVIGGILGSIQGYKVLTLLNQ